MSKCECTMRISILGEGCRYCQPQGLIDTHIHIIDEMEDEIEDFKEEIRQLKQVAFHG